MLIYPLFAIIFWGLSFVATKIALRELSPAILILLRFTIGALILAGALAFKKYPLKIKKSDIFLLLFCGLIIAIHISVQVNGMRFTTASNTAWIVATSPVFVAILSRLVFKERFSFLKIVGITLAVLGVMFLVSKGELKNISFIRSPGDWMILVSSFTWAIYSIASKKLLDTYSTILITFYSLAIICILTLPLSLNHQSLVSVLKLSKVGWMAIFYLGIFCSGIAYLFWSKALKGGSAGEVSVYLYLEPLVATLGAYLILKEAITIWTFLGGALIILGIYVVSVKRGLITVG